MGFDKRPELDVSRETMQRFEVFERLVHKWNPHINLVSRNSLSDFWMRHIIDSVQVYQAAPTWRHWVDMGSGGGFPGVIVAILAKEAMPDGKIHLIESDMRKSEFLRTAIRDIGVECEVITDRIDNVASLQADIVSARALAPLSTLLAYCERHMAKNGTAIFSKGISWKKELESAREQWSFDLDVIESQTMSGAVLLKIKGASRV